MRQDLDEPDRWIEQLAQFQPPVHMLSLVQRMAGVPNDRFFNDPVYKPLYEAWAAGYFLLGLEQLYGNHMEVRLDPDHFPDFHVRQEGREYEFELTTADKPERRRGLEYKERATYPLLLTPYQPARGRQQGADWVANAIGRKHRKRYSASPHLLVYANFDAETLEPQELASACRPWAASFRSIWILCDYSILQLFDSEMFGPARGVWCSVGIDPLAQN